ncbi:MAG TPA: hypothetical protein VKK61_02210 [Tepidisphaeraceae bacterium]|nr:hypothetical protein [Tepidisphaeraceae bacterium]
MSEKKIREKYGGKLAKAINRAIRAEIPGGNAALDKLTQLAGPALHSGWYDSSGNPTPEAANYFKHKHNVVDKMEATIRGKWNIPVSQRKLNKKSDKRRPNRK